MGERCISMKKIVLALFVAGVLALAGCGSDDDRPHFFTQILSDATLDGDIARDSVTSAYTVAQGNTESVFAGFDPVDGDEFRAFLDFPLTGSGGVPGNAVITGATLDIVISEILPNPLPDTTPIPLRIDLVSFDPPLLIGNDFDRTLQPALATITVSPPISQADFGQHVLVDVTDLMKEAQRLGLAHLQLRILRDPGVAAAGLIEINDTTGPNRSQLAPLLEVSYF